MNKTQLIDAVALESELTKADAKKAIDAFIKITVEQLKQGERIALLGFGTFSVTERPAHLGRNPRTGAEMQIEKKNIIKFKPGSEVSNEVQ